MSQPRDRAPSGPGQSQESGHPPAWRRGPTFFSLVFRSPLSLGLLCALTFVATLLLLEGPSRQGDAFWRSRGAWLWHLLFALWPVLLVVSIAAVFRDIRRGNRSVWPDTYGERLAVVFYMAIGVILGALPPLFFHHTLSILPTNLDAITQISGTATKNFIMSMLALAVLFLHCSGFISVHVQLISWLSTAQPQGEEPGSERLNEDVLRYLRLRSQLRRFFRAPNKNKV